MIQFYSIDESNAITRCNQLPAFASDSIRFDWIRFMSALTNQNSESRYQVNFF